MKQEEYNATIRLMDDTSAEILEVLDGLDPRSEEYEQAAKNLKLVQEAKNLEVRNMTEEKNSRVPGWATGILGSGLAFLMGMVIYRGEASGKVIGSAASSLLSKLRFH